MFSTSHAKVFKCPIHNYISVPHNIVTDFIDTPIFQRLRHIEQTCMRPLYPSAHHDRFSHSLGVFHLSSIAFHHIVKNTDCQLLDGVDLKSYKWVFCITALMHDCAHSPFSHTFENYYQQSNNAKKFLFSQVDQEFKDDYDIREKLLKGPSAHEIFSAAIFLKHFGTKLKRIAPDIDPILAARMITGVVFSKAKDTKKQIENCLIMLINGSAIDLDKLDYVIRDTWASGVCNVKIDTPRLLSALRFDKYKQKLVPSFHKSALSVIQNVVDGRNYLYRWIYTHHTVCYFDHLLKEAGKKLFDAIDQGNKEDFIDTLFSKEVFEKNVESCGVHIYLPSDGDLIYLMKQHRECIPEIDEILSRKPKLIPLWKTQAEFDCIFETKPTSDQQEDIWVRHKQILASALEDEVSFRAILPLRAKPNVIDICETDIYVSINQKVKSFKNINTGNQTQNTKANAFYYIFIPKECASIKDKCIAAISSEISYQ